jgi:ATP-dependent Clp protease ATP-binding subunit ClpA
LKRAIQTHIEDVLAEHLLLGRYPAGSTIEVDANADDGLVMRAAEQKTPVEVS